MHFVHLHFCRLLPSCSTCVTLRDISDHLAKLGAEYDSALEYRELTVSGSGGTTVVAATRLTVGRKGKNPQHLSMMMTAKQRSESMLFCWQ